MEKFELDQSVIGSPDILSTEEIIEKEPGAVIAEIIAEMLDSEQNKFKVWKERFPEFIEQAINSGQYEAIMKTAAALFSDIDFSDPQYNQPKSSIFLLKPFFIGKK